jgi:dephospho-CoA kinase
MLLGLTGGIATGKSTLTRLLAKAHPFTVFDADACVHEMLRTDREVLAKIYHEFSLPRTVEALPLDRTELRRLVFSDSTARHRLEAIIHPVVRQALDGIARRVP